MLVIYAIAHFVLLWVPISIVSKIRFSSLTYFLIRAVSVLNPSTKASLGPFIVISFSALLTLRIGIFLVSQTKDISSVSMIIAELPCNIASITLLYVSAKLTWFSVSKLPSNISFRFKMFLDFIILCEFEFSTLMPRINWRSKLLLIISESDKPS